MMSIIESQAQRDALIADCKADIDRLHTDIKYASSKRKPELQSQLLRQQIALATLGVKFSWPGASEESAKGGWTLSTEFICKVGEVAGDKYGYPSQMEETEAVLLAALEVYAPPVPVAESIIPDGLNPATAELVTNFAKALTEKLLKSEQKYGWSDNWKESDWQEKCLADFQRHITKGDPRDVAAYCAFMWYHGWKTALPVTGPVAVAQACQHEWTLTTIRA